MHVRCLALLLMTPACAPEPRADLVSERHLTPSVASDRIVAGGAVLAERIGGEVLLTRRGGGSLRVGEATLESGDGLDPTWVALADGVALSWTVAAPAPTVEVRLPHPGATLTRSGDLVSVRSPEGDWTVGRLAAYDADGAPLPFSWEVEGDTLRLDVDTALARFPVVVDPFYSAAVASWTGDADGSRFGGALLGPGDLDGDGWADLVVGAWGASAYAGQVSVYGGGPTGPTASPVTLLSGEAEEGIFGFSLGVGDFNGDAAPDLAVGIPGQNEFDGAVALYAGTGAGLPDARTSVLLAASTGESYGWAVAGLGDIDGDGIDDLGVGANSWYQGTGRASVYLGSPTGVDPTTLVATVGIATTDHVGDTVAGGGDLDGDGYADVLIGASGATRGVGAVSVFPGSVGGMDASRLVTLTGVSSGDLFGLSVASPGDLDGDGFADVVVGAPGRDAATGAVYTYLGSAAGVANVASVAVDGSAEGDWFGWSVAGAGDLEGDGLPDVLVGALLANGTTGGAYELRGAPGGVDPDPVTSMAGAVAWGYHGSSVAGLGDVDGDGGDDIAVGAEGGWGAVYVYGGYEDADRDGVEASEDCDDHDPATYPGAPEQISDGVDEDCDGQELCFVDADGDHWRPDVASTVVSADLDCAGPGEADRTASVGDCDDGDPTIHPTATEVVGDEIDQTCDGLELCFADADRDGYGTSATVLSRDVTCGDPGELPAGAPLSDCDDAAAEIHPGAPEIVVDGVDQDCDGGDLCYADADGDSFRAEEDATVASPDLSCLEPGEADGTVPGGDCDDTARGVHPGARENVGDGVDSDCDGAEVCYVDADQDGARVDDTTPGASVACDGDGQALATADPDCDDADPTRYPAAEEVVDDGLDQDCDGGDRCYPDADADGYRPDVGTVASADLACDDAGELGDGAPAGDCDDEDPAIHPGATERPDDGIDQDCDHSDLTRGVPVTDPTKDTLATCGCATGPDPADAPLVGLAAGGALLLLKSRRRSAPAG